MLKKGWRIICAVIVVFAMTMPCFAENVATSGVTEENESTQGVTTDVYDIVTGEQSIDDLDMLQEIVEGSDDFNMAEDSVLTVVVPSNLDFKIDPFMVNGRGQIYSEDFIIQNYSNQDVKINLVNIKYAFKNDTDFVSLNAPPEIPFGLAHTSNFKEIYMVLRYANKDLPDFVITDKEMSESADIILAASKYDSEGNFISLGEESTVVFNFSGIVNHMPSTEWEEGDVSVFIEYDMTAVEEPASEEVEQEPTEAEEPASEEAEQEPTESPEDESANNNSSDANPQAAGPEVSQPPDLQEPADVSVDGEPDDTGTMQEEESVNSGDNAPDSSEKEASPEKRGG